MVESNLLERPKGERHGAVHLGSQLLMFLPCFVRRRTELCRCCARGPKNLTLTVLFPLSRRTHRTLHVENLIRCSKRGRK